MERSPWDLDPTKKIRSQEARNYTCNITWLRIPLDKSTSVNSAASDITMSALSKVVNHLWYEKETHKLRLPLRWPKGGNITVALTSQVEAPSKGEWQVVAGEVLVLAYYLLLAMAKKECPADVEVVLAFGRTFDVSCFLKLFLLEVSSLRRKPEFQEHAGGLSVFHRGLVPNSGELVRIV